MEALFADLPEALASTVEIAQRSAFRPRGRKPILPSFVIPTLYFPKSSIHPRFFQYMSRI